KERTTRELQAASRPGLTFTYYSYNGTSRLSTVTTSQGWSVAYSYYNFGSELDRISTILVRDDTFTTVKRVDYLYYGNVTSPHTDIGWPSDLNQVKVSTLNSDGSTWDV